MLRRLNATQKRKFEEVEEETSPSQSKRRDQHKLRVDSVDSNIVSHFPLKKLERAEDIKKKYLEIKVATSMTSAVSLIADKVVISGDMTHFNRIKEDAVQLVVWRRSSVPSFLESLCDHRLPIKALPSFKGTLHPSALAEKLESRTLKLAEAIGGSMVKSLIEDICILAHSFAEVTGSEKICVRLEHFGDDGCAFWHQDSVPFRLVATYRGPCTEYVHPHYSDATLRRRKHDSKHAQALYHTDVALFKGRGPSNETDTLLKHPGIVHRSPRIMGSRIHRLLLVLDLPL